MNDEIKDSSKLQLTSLCAFMTQIGYTYCRGQFLGSDFSGAPIVTIQTAVRIYNGGWHKVGNGYVPEFHANVLNSPFEFDSYVVTKALASKILVRIKLQANKKGWIKCQNNKIEFVHPEYYELFKEELK